MRLSPVVLVEGGDADGLAEGEEITLKNWGNVKITKLDKDGSGECREPSRALRKHSFLSSGSHVYASPTTNPCAITCRSLRHFARVGWCTL